MASTRAIRFLAVMRPQILNVATFRLCVNVPNGSEGGPEELENDPVSASVLKGSKDELKESVNGRYLFICWLLSLIGPVEVVVVPVAVTTLIPLQIDTNPIKAVLVAIATVNIEVVHIPALSQIPYRKVTWNARQTGFSDWWKIQNAQIWLVQIIDQSEHLCNNKQLGYNLIFKFYLSRFVEMMIFKLFGRSTTFTGGKQRRQRWRQWRGLKRQQRKQQNFQQLRPSSVQC